MSGYLPDGTTQEMLDSYYRYDLLGEEAEERCWACGAYWSQACDEDCPAGASEPAPLNWDDVVITRSPAQPYLFEPEACDAA